MWEFLSTTVCTFAPLVHQHYALVSCDFFGLPSLSLYLYISIFTALATFRSLSRKLGFSAPTTLTLSLSHSSLESRVLRAPFRNLDFLAVLGFTDLHSSCLDLRRISLFLRHVLEAHISLRLFTCMWFLFLFFYFAESSKC